MTKTTVHTKYYCVANYVRVSASNWKEISFFREISALEGNEREMKIGRKKKEN